MKRKIIFRALSFIITLLLIIPPLYSQAKEQADRDKLIQELLEKSGAEQQISQLPEVIKVLLPIELDIYGVKGEVASAFAEFNEKISTEFFVATDILEMVSKHLQQNFNRSHIERYLKWLDTKLGKKITKMEVDASSPEAALAIMTFAMELQEKPPEENRLALIERLIKTLDISEKGAKRSGAIFLEVTTGINQNLPQDRRIPEDMMKKMKTAFQKTMVTQLESFLVPTFLYTYQSLSDKELNKYINFLDTKAARWLTQNLFEAQLIAIEKDCRKFGRALGKEIAKIEPPKKNKLKWTKFNSPDGTFSLEFPAETESQTQEIPAEMGPIVMNMLSSEINGIVFMLSWVDDYPPLKQEQVNVKQILINGAQGSAISTGGQIIEQEFITLQGYPGVDFEVSIAALRGLIRSKIFLMENSLYQLMAIGSARDVLSKENDRFFDSFKVAKR